MPFDWSSFRFEPKYSKEDILWRGTKKGMNKVRKVGYIPLRSFKKEGLSRSDFNERERISKEVYRRGFHGSYLSQIKEVLKENDGELTKRDLIKKVQKKWKDFYEIPRYCDVAIGEYINWLENEGKVSIFRSGPAEIREKVRI